SEGFFGQPYGKPVAHLREVIESVRLIVAKAHTGELDKYAGEYVNLDFDFFQPTAPPVRTEIPIWVAALRGPLVRLGAEIADGVIGHPLWSVRWATTEIPKYIDEGLTLAGRTRADIDVNLWVWTSPGIDKKTATEEARATMAFYGGAEQYHSYFDWHGFGDVVVKLQNGLREGTRYQDLAHLVPDEMVQEFILCGTPDEVREQLAPLWEIATSVTPVPAAWGLPMDRLITYMDSIGRTFYPGLREG
ncbi:MAG: LLM class flavin-dependent oxidoreductase, partial [Acidobacteria bacterium]